MNYSIIFYIIGWILNLEAAFMLPSCLVALIYQESSGWSLVAAVLLCLLDRSSFGYKEAEKPCILPA